MGQEQILAEVRGQIVGGVFNPGDRLPNRTELQARFGASSHTVQRAMHRLIDAGFLVSRGRAGTFVAENAPHLCRYGLVFPIHLDAAHGGTWATLWGQLDRQARQPSGRSDLSIEPYYEIIRGGTNSELRRLRRDLAERRLAGLMVVAPNHLPHDLQPARLPVPCSGLACDGYMAEMPTVQPSMEAVDIRAARYLGETGASRVAILANHNRGLPQLRALGNELAKRGLITQPRWLLGVDPRQAHWAGRAVQAMLHTDQHAPPDALYIEDDSLFDAAMAGLVEIGRAPGRDLHVIAHANFPLETPSPWQVPRIGFDARVVLRTMIELIDWRREQEARLAPCIPIDVVFQENPSAAAVDSVLPYLA